MAKSKMSGMMPAEQPPYDHRIEMRRTDGAMKMSHIVPMGKNKKMTEKAVKEMIEKMFGKGE